MDYHLTTIEGHRFLVDADVFERFKGSRIYTQDNCPGSGRLYFKVMAFDASTGKNHLKRLQRIIMDAPPGMEVDHVDGNYFDLRRQSLRLVPPAQNARNKKLIPGKGLKGATWDKRERRWRASIAVGGKQVWLGYHCCERDAALAYNRASRTLHGEYGRTNPVGEASVHCSLVIAPADS